MSKRNYHGHEYPFHVVAELFWIRDPDFIVTVLIKELLMTNVKIGTDTRVLPHTASTYLGWNSTPLCGHNCSLKYYVNCECSKQESACFHSQQIIKRVRNGILTVDVGSTVKKVMGIILIAQYLSVHDDTLECSATDDHVEHNGAYDYWCSRKDGARITSWQNRTTELTNLSP
jgi:hypothetical protein